MQQQAELLSLYCSHYALFCLQSQHSNERNKDTYNNIFTARGMGDGIGIGSKVVSGAMRKLVTDGYVEKMGENPVVYSLTDKGMTIDLSAE